MLTVLRHPAARRGASLAVHLSAFLAAFAISCRTPLCGCAPPPPSVDGAWTGTTAASDQIRVSLWRRAADSVYGNGTVLDATGAQHLVIVTGHAPPGYNPVHLTISGWRSGPVTFDGQMIRVRTIEGSVLVRPDTPAVALRLVPTPQ